MSASSHLSNNHDDTVIASNVSAPTTNLFKSLALRHFPTSRNYACASFTLKTNDPIYHSRATQVFVMAGTPVINKRITTNPLKVSLADGQQVTSTHMRDKCLNGLPFPIMGHIIPELS
jgi:hypothetical protein